MNYIKVFSEKICGYLIDTLFPKTNRLLTNENLYSLPKAENNEPYIFSIFYYKNATIKKLIKLIKYKGNKEATKQASGVIYEYLLEDMSEKMEINNFIKPIIIPLPATKHRMKEYGFNQCERIVKCIEKKDSEKYFEFLYDLLIKIKDCKSQAHTKNRVERLKNIKNSFGVNLKDRIRGRNIILIDDVWTTGATINEARSELLKAGAKNVIAYTIAH